MSNHWIRVATLPHSIDLARFTHYLQVHGIPHRISEEQNHQVIWCTDQQSAAIVMSVLEKVATGEVTLPNLRMKSVNTNPEALSYADYLTLTPLTLLFIALSIAGAALVHIDPYMRITGLFTFQQPFFSHGLTGYISLGESLREGQIWRLFSPMFLHFSLLHILFNSLWMWELGRRIERVESRYTYFLMVMGMSLCANLTQYWVGGPSIFGGMSGVIYGLLGYIWIRQKLNPHPLLAVPSGMIIFMLLWLFACIAGVTEVFMQGGVANGAHVGGLLAGMALGWLHGQRKQPPHNSAQ